MEYHKFVVAIHIPDEAIKEIKRNSVRVLELQRVCCTLLLLQPQWVAQALHHEK